MSKIEIYWEDLNQDAQLRLAEALEGSKNVDAPIAIIEMEDEK